MKLTFLGTAAAEGMPAVFCNCDFCNEARKLGGKNIRTRSQALVNEDLLIDLPADTYFHFLRDGIRGDRIRHLLITHSHSDHLYPKELAMRKPPFAHNMVPELEVYCGEDAYRMLEGVYPEKTGFSVTLLEPFVPTRVGSYQVTALPARHAPGDGALFYIIRGERTILYAHDTGYFYEEVFEYLQTEGIRFDLVTFDCTNVDIPIGDEGNHMGIPNLLRVAQRLEATGAIDNSTVKIINHFSHNGNPLQHLLEKRMEGTGFLVSYDGMTVEF